MSDFFLELFSEEIPSGLQKNARNEMLKLFQESFIKLNISFKSSNSYSTPRRLVIIFYGISDKIEQKEMIIRGPKIDSPAIALDGFLKSNNLNRDDVYEQSTEKGNFFSLKFFQKPF